MRNQVLFYLNDERIAVPAEQSGLMLSEFLRHERGLTGTKVVCAEGDCGACSVLKLVPSTRRKAHFLPINSCIVTLAQCDGTSLITVEALAREGVLSPIQSAMVESHGSQCGFCTPGFVIALTGLVEKKLCAGIRRGTCTPRDAKNATTGNLCRCTGYQPILDAVSKIDLSACESITARFYTKAQAIDLKKIRSKPLRIQTETILIEAPKKITEAVKQLSKNPDFRVVGAATDLGVAVNKGKLKLPAILSLHLIDELTAIKFKKNRVYVGARVTLSELREALKEKIPEFSRFLDLFASPQIKNSATLVGNIANGSPIGDTPPFLLVAGARIYAVGPRGKRNIPFEKFYLGYRKNALRRGELISGVEFDIPKATESLALYKSSQRKDLDISTVNAAFRVEWVDLKRTKMKTARIALGGVAATPLRIFSAEKILAGNEPTPRTLAAAAVALQNTIFPMADLRGSTEFRRVLVDRLFLKFFREIER